VFLDVLEHPIAAHVVLVAACDTEQPSMVTHDGPAELGNIVFEINKVLGLLVGCHIVEMNILVAPFKVVDDALICQLLLDDENVLEEVDDPLLDVEVVELRDHCLLVLQISLILVDERISLIDDVSDVVEDCTVRAHVQLGKLLRQVLVFLFLLLQLVVHVLDLDVIPLQLTNNQLLILSPTIKIKN